MSPKIILTLVLSFIITCFSIFNTTPVELNLFGFKMIQLPLSFFLFLVFLTGAVYAGMLTFYDQIQKTVINKKLKRKVLDLNNKIEELRTVIEKQERRFGEQVGQEKSAEETITEDSENDEDKATENPLLEVVDPHEGNDRELTSESREFALKRIQNG